MSEEMNQTQDTAVEQATTAPAADLGFHAQLPEDIRGEASLQDIKDLNSLAKGYVNAQKMIGSSIRIPSEDAGVEAKEEFYKKLESVQGVVRLPDTDNKEAMDAFYGRLGRPDTADNYRIEAPEGSEQAVNEFKQIAHQIGLTNEQASKLVGFELEKAKQAQEAATAAYDSAQSTLKDAWGNDYDNRLKGAKEAAAMYAGKYPDAMKQLIEGPAGNNPALLSMLSELYGTMKESQAVIGNRSISYGHSPDEALGQISDIRSNKNHPYNIKKHPEHANAVAKVQALYKAAYPGEE